MPRARRIVLAFGGNALIAKGQEGNQWEQIKNAEQMARMIVPLVSDGHRIVIVHGNGPQVGNILIQVEEAVTKIPPSPSTFASRPRRGASATCCRWRCATPSAAPG